MLDVPPQILKRNPNYKPSPPIKRNSGLNGAMPTVYDAGWQLFNDLNADQIAWYQAQPEWQNFVSWVALDPPNATIHADAPDMNTIIAALTAANVTAMPLGVVTPASPTGPKMKSPFDSSPL